MACVQCALYGTNRSMYACQNAIQAISPAILRIGGTTGDKIYYDMSNQPQDPPPSPYKV